MDSGCKCALLLRAKGPAQMLVADQPAVAEGHDPLGVLGDLPLMGHDQDGGAALVELAEKKGLNHIKPAPIDLSSFKFLEGSFREGDGVGYGEAALWREYVTGIMEGKILSNDPSDMMITIPPEEVAGIINNAMSDKLDDESCNRVINKYLRRKAI